MENTRPEQNYFDVVQGRAPFGYLDEMGAGQIPARQLMHNQNLLYGQYELSGRIVVFKTKSPTQLRIEALQSELRTLGGGENEGITRRSI